MSDRSTPATALSGHQLRGSRSQPVVAIVGRPNVGKSTLLNRVVGRREAIVEEMPGVTRDRKVLEADWAGRNFLLVDTGGWLAGGSDLDAKVTAQAERAMADADVVLFVVDATTGITDEDDRAAGVVRRLRRPTLLVVNKVDDVGREPNIWEFLALGLGDPNPISALHGRGTGDLLDELVAKLPDTIDHMGVGANESTTPDETMPGADAPLVSSLDADADSVLAVAIVGRPNVGKSTLFNRLTGEERSVVHDEPGTTRDTIDTVVDTPEGPVRLVDTAGLRRRSRVDRPTEYFSLVRTLAAVDRADVALLLIDATEGVTHQDQRLAERIDAAGCPVVVLLNKWELLDAEARDAVRGELGRRLAFIGDAVVLEISALTGKNVHRLIPALGEVVDAYHRRVPTRQVNDVIAEAQAAHPAPGGARVLYATQGAADPPTFTLFTNRELPRTYVRFLERKLREAFDLGQTPVKVRVRRRGS